MQPVNILSKDRIQETSFFQASQTDMSRIGKRSMNVTGERTHPGKEFLWMVAKSI
jgi:hypothetical protein